MKFFPLRTICAMMVIAVVGSCDKNIEPTTDPVALTTPTVTASVENRNVTISWNAIDNAVSYSWSLDGCSARSTDQTTVTVSASDLEAGEHTVSVTAMPALNSNEFTASEAGTATFTIEGQAVKLDTPSINATSDNNAGTLTLFWEAIDNAASYRYCLDDGSWTTTEETSVILQIADLEVGDHTFNVIADPEEGSTEYLSSDSGEYAFSIEAQQVEPNEQLQQWIGTYAVTCSQRIVMDYNGSISMNKEDIEGEFTVTIEPSTSADYVWIYGMSQLGNYPLWGTIHTDESGKSYLSIVTGTMAITQDADGKDMICLPLCEDSNGSILFITGTDYAFLIDPDTMESIPNSGSLQDGRTFTTLAADIFSVEGNSTSIYYQDFPVYIPAGTFTFTKTETTSANTLKVLNKSDKAVVSIFTSVAR